MTTNLLNTRRAPAVPPAPRSRNARRGASLVEVLIVLTIILIGVFIAIQIFPIGFTSLKRDEARLRADRLARSATETLLADEGALPESISFSYYVGDPAVLQTITDVDPDDFGIYQDDPNNGLYFSDVNKFRYIKNEPVAVPLATATGSTGFGDSVGSIHFLTFGPIFMSREVGSPTQAPADLTPVNTAPYDTYLKVTSDKLVGRVVNATQGTGLRNETDFIRYLRGANTYVIDYGDDDSRPVILFPQAGKGRRYTVTYSYEIVPADDTLPVEVQTTSTTIDVAAGDFTWKTLGANSIIAGSEVVVRDFTRLKGDDPATATTEGDSWDPADPYEYKLVSSNISDNANLGVIAFNPAGANYSVSVPGGVKPFTALVSYAVLDWHILHDDREVPNGGINNVGAVRTTLPGIKVRGDETVDLTATGANRTRIYPGLYPQARNYIKEADIPPASESPDIQVFNLSSADGKAKLLNSYDPADPGSTPGDYQNRAADAALPVLEQPYFWIDRTRTGGTYPSGVIYINTSRVPAGSKVRILYKAIGDWAIAFQKAAKAYKQQEVAGQVPVGNKSEVFALSNNGTVGDFADDRIVFHRTELNKSATVTVEITTIANNGVRRIARLPVRQFSIRNAADAYAYADIADIVSEFKSGKYKGDSITGWRVVGDINGVSLKTRVIWKDEENGRSRFHQNDLETFVSRQGQ